MIPFLRPCRAAAPRMTGGRPPVPGPCDHALPLPHGRPAQGAASSAVRPCAPAPEGVPYTVALAVHLYRGFPPPRASRSGRGASAVWRWAPAPAGVPRHHPPLNLRRDGFPLPRASRTRSRWPCICTVASRSRGRPAQGAASSAVRPCAPARASPRRVPRAAMRGGGPAAAALPS